MNLPTRFKALGRAILVGPSIDLPRVKQTAWIRSRLKRAGIARSDFLVAVDGGVRFFTGNRPAARTPELLPDLLIGDWDSGRLSDARQLARRGAELVVLPTRKNESDLAAVLSRVARLPLRQLLLFGFTGGRADHHLSDLLEIAEFAAAHASSKKFQKIAAFGPEGEYHFLTSSQPEFRLALRPGTPVSVFALRGRAKGVRMKGFEYNLRGEDLEPGSRGLSNLAREKEVRIRVRQGVLVVCILTVVRRAR